MSPGIASVRSPFLIFLISFLVLWGSAWLGSRFGPRITDLREDLGLVLTATLTLLGLILGFALSMAVSRYDQRKLFEEQEANAIGTEYIRVDLLPTAARDDVRRLLREFLHQRILFYQTNDPQRLAQIETASTQLETQLWAGVQNPAMAQPTPLMALAVSGMNDVLNSQGYTQFAWWNLIPIEAWALMGLVALSVHVMAGLYFRHVRYTGVLLAVLAVVVSMAFFLIADIDSPRGGLIRVAPMNLISTAQSLGA